VVRLLLLRTIWHDRWMLHDVVAARVDAASPDGISGTTLKINFADGCRAIDFRPTLICCTLNARKCIKN
jgi:hypothetical protein